MMRIKNADVADKVNNLIYSDLSYKIIGIFYKTHNQLGRYCNEKQYGDFIEKYLKEAELKYEREKKIEPLFEGEKKGRNIIDFLVEDKIVVEIKAKRIITREDYYQSRRYLQALNKKLGIIVNFRNMYLRPKRILNSQYKV